MEPSDHFKNGAYPKSHMSRENQYFIMIHFTKSLFLFVIVAITTTPVFAASKVSSEPVLAKDQAPTVTGLFLQDGQSMTADDFLKLTPKQIEESTGEKLGIKERLALRYAQSKIKKEIKKGHVARDTEFDLNNVAAEGGMTGMAVAGFVCSLVGIFIAGILLGTLGIIFSAIALGKIKKTGKRGRGLAIAGLIIGIVAVAGAALILAGVISV